MTFKKGPLMKLLMLLLLVFPVLAKADPEFVKNYFIGSPYEAFNKQFKGAPYEDQCIPETVSACKSKFNKACSCKRLDLVSYQAFKKTLFVTVADGKIVEYLNKTVNAANFPPSQAYQKVSAFFGDTQPIEVHEGPNDGSSALFFLVWKLDSGYASSTITCPVQILAGVSKVTTPLRDCWAKTARISSIIKEPTLPGGLKGKIKMPY